MKSITALLFACSVGTVSASWAPGNLGPGKCDKGFRKLGTGVGSEIKISCYNSCVAQRNGCVPSDGFLSTGANCRRSCEQNCDRCTRWSPFFYDQEKREPGCPKPACLVKSDNYDKCRAVCGKGRAGQRYMRYAEKALTDGGILPGAWWKNMGQSVCVFTCRCKGMQSGEDGCDLLPPMKGLGRLRGGAALDEMNYDEEEAGGFSIEGGYNKGPYNVNVKWEKDEDEYDNDGEEEYDYDDEEEYDYDDEEEYDYDDEAEYDYDDEAEYDYDDEEAGGLSIEGGYNKGPYNVNVKWENDEAEYDYDDEEVGGLSIEGGYNKGPYNVNVKWENDELGEETRSPSSAKFGDKLRERVKSRLFIKWARTHLKKEKALARN